MIGSIGLTWKSSDPSSRVTPSATAKPHSTPTPEVYGRGSMILADGKLITLGEGGILGLFKPNSKQAEEICRYQVPQLHHPCWAAPVLSRKKLYLRSEDHLVCLELVK